ncbi:hypothetical protein [Phaffia rhodozyma]|uniref:Uncharacterized protein n=1 Tax=Phaffia rhodozyma TaxID=264483 RepID=A0A0F7SU11_PHARH|nr:hypothetical protein [Phaffia rhodozyma]
MTELDTPMPSLEAMTQHMVSPEESRSDRNQNNRPSHFHYQRDSRISHPKPRQPRRASIDCGALKIGSKSSLVSSGVSPDEHVGKGTPTTTPSGKSIHRRPSHKTGHPRPVLLHHLPRSSLYTPIPPSLLTSPLLNSPESPFFVRSVCPLSSTSSPVPSLRISPSPATPPTTPFQFPPISFLPPFSSSQQQMLAFCSPHPPSPPISDDRSDQRRNSTEFIWPNSMLADQPEHSQPSSHSLNRRQLQDLGV